MVTGSGFKIMCVEPDSMVIHHISKHSHPGHNAANRFVAVSPCRDIALSVTALSFNLWFTKLYCKDFRLVSMKICDLDANGTMSVKQ